MYKFILSTLLFTVIFFPIATLGQVTYDVENFSDDYSGKIYFSDTTEVFSKGWIAIFDKKTNKQIIFEASEELSFDAQAHGNKIIANIQQLPYGEQSHILYNDFNFDGLKDFAIMDGQNSCYHGPSYKIYLASSEGFKLNDNFTELAQGYCGMFEVDTTTKTIHTMLKSGCCWHQFSEFKVINNIPVEIKSLTESNFDGFITEYSEGKLINGKMVETNYKILSLYLDSTNIILSYELKNKKKMHIIKTENILHYAFLDSADKIELHHMDNFKYSAKTNTLKFTYLKTEYTISNDRISIKTPKRTREIFSAPNTQMGKLENLRVEKFDNVMME